MRISDWSSDVCSSDLVGFRLAGEADLGEDGDAEAERLGIEVGMIDVGHPPIILQIPEDSAVDAVQLDPPHASFSIFRRVCAIILHDWERAKVAPRSEEHTSELQSLTRISYAVFCLKKKTYHYKYKRKSTEQ